MVPTFGSSASSKNLTDATKHFAGAGFFFFDRCCMIYWILVAVQHIVGGGDVNRLEIKIHTGWLGQRGGDKQNISMVKDSFGIVCKRKIGNLALENQQWFWE